MHPRIAAMERARAAGLPLFELGGVYYDPASPTRPVPARRAATILGHPTYQLAGRTRCTATGELLEPDREAARQEGRLTYLDPEGRRRMTATGAICRTEAPRPPMPPARKTAREARQPTYFAPCPAHGIRVPHYTHNGACAQCYTTDGRLRAPPRPAASPARVDARRTGSPTYLAACPVHGPGVPHHTQRGLCAQCYNSLGSPRPASTNPAGYYWCHRTQQGLPAPKR